MSERLCAVDGCDNPMSTGDNSTTCPGCWNRYTQALAETPALIEQLEITLSRQDALGDADHIRGTDTPLAYHKGASDALTDLLDALHAWTRATKAQPSPRPWNSLLNHDARTHPEAHHLVGEITNARDRGWHTVDTHPDRMLLGQCGALTNGVECPEQLKAIADKATVKCQTCGAEWDVADRKAWAVDRIDRTLATNSEARTLIAKYAGVYVTQQQISRWKQRGQLMVAQHDGHGREMFLIGDIRHLADEHARRLDKSSSA